MPESEKLKALVLAAQAADGLAFAELVSLYQDDAVGYATSILRDHHLAEDAAQDAFVEAYRALQSLREPAAFPGWFRTIVFKHCDRLKRRKRHRIAGLDAAQEVASTGPSPHETAETQDAIRQAYEAVAALSENERSVVLLHYIGERSHAEIAEFLGVNENTAKTRLHAARQRLRKQMEDKLRDHLRATRPSNDPRFVRRVIAAALPLQIYCLDDRGLPQQAGSTIGARDVQVPASCTVAVEPRQTLTDKDWNTLFGLMSELQIQGLSAEGQVTDALLERIAKLDHVTWLSLPGSAQITNMGLRHLAKMPRLEHLTLSGARITDAGLGVLRHLPELKSLSLPHQGGISDAGLTHLAHCPLLQRVNLMGTSTGDGAVRALTAKPCLREFYAGSLITDAGLERLHEFPVFKNWQGGDADMSLMKFTAHPNYLWLNLKAPITNAGLETLKGLDGLFALNLFGGDGPGTFDARNSPITPAGLPSLAGLTNLCWLGCNSLFCTDEAMAHIARMPRLRFLMCQDAKAGDNGFATLGQSQSIEYIWGRRCYNLAGRGFAALAAMPRLRGLSVSCKNVDDAGLSALPRFPSLKAFMPMDVPDEGFRHIGRCEQLEALHCMYCDATSDASIDYITGLNMLKVYEAWSTQISDSGLEQLSRIKSLERVLIYNCKAVSDAGLSFLAGLPRLRQVTLETLPNVTPEGPDVFPEHVRVNLVT